MTVASAEPRVTSSRGAVVLNGKYLASKHRTGVFRVADQLIRHVDKQFSGETDRAGWDMLCPPDVIGVPTFETIRPRIVGPLTWQTWEQFQLPLASRGQLLVNLCNLAPIAHPGAITMIHDAQVFISPQSYSRAFAAWYQFILPRIGASARAILTVSEYSRRQLAEHGVCDYDRIEVLHNGADHILDHASDAEILKSLGLEPETYVLAFSSTQSHKNLQVLFAAFQRPELAHTRLVLVGPTGAEAYGQAGMTPPSDTVYAGKTNDGQLRALLEGAACLAFPSTTEGFGLPPLEAMTVGCPVVAAPCGALSEVCGDAAVFAEPNAPEDWAVALQAFVSSADLRRDYRSRGLENALHYRWSVGASRLISVVERYS